MPSDTLAKRVEALERQVTELSSRVSNINGEPDWRRAIGMFAGDDFMKKIFEEGRKIREADRKKQRSGRKK